MPKEGAKSKKNTSKTARVLGLLTSPPPTEEPLEETSAASSRGRAASVKPADDRAVESQVRSALESELEELLPPPEEPMPPADLPGEEPPLQDTPAGEPAPEELLPDAEEPVFEELIPPTLDRPADEPPPVIVPPAPAPEPARSVTIRARPAPEPEPEPGFTCFNVMQALVESKTEKYIKLFGLCSCSRCHTDVVALALTNLPAKYVVASDEDMVPLLSVYEGTYSAAVISQVMNACKQVMAHPRHKL